METALAFPSALADPDADLVRSMADGDEDALRSLYALYGRRLLAYALRLAADQALAATLGLVAVVPPDFLGGIILNWLGPMASLSSLALVLATQGSATGAIATALALWLGRGWRKG